MLRTPDLDAWVEPALTLPVLFSPAVRLELQTLMDSFLNAGA